MRLEDISSLRQAKGYSMHMMADFLQISFEAYAELEFEVRTANTQEWRVLEILLK